MRWAWGANLWNVYVGLEYNVSKFYLKLVQKKRWRQKPYKLHMSTNNACLPLPNSSRVPVFCVIGNTRELGIVTNIQEKKMKRANLYA